MSFYEQSVRFYQSTPQGIVPFSEVPKANGKGMRKATIADAKAMNPRPFPSVTSVIRSTLAKPALESWKMRKVAEAALTLPRLPNENDEEFIARIAEDAFEEAGEAADLGTDIHEDLSKWIENGMTYIDGFECNPVTCISPYTHDCKRWLSKNVTKVYSSEKVVANKEYGYAGRMDLHCYVQGVTTIIDFKSSKVKRNANGEPKPVFYRDSWPLQLSAYQRCDGVAAAKIISIIIDTSEPGPCFVKDWTDEYSCTYYFDLFCKVLDLWKYNNDWI